MQIQLQEKWNKTASASPSHLRTEPSGSQWCLQNLVLRNSRDASPHPFIPLGCTGYPDSSQAKFHWDQHESAQPSNLYVHGIGRTWWTMDMGEHWMTLVSSCSVCQIPSRNHHESIASYIDLGSQVPARSRSFQVLCLERRFKKEDDVYTRKRSWSRVSRTQVPDVISILRQNTARTWPRESQSLAFSRGFPGQWLQWRSSILDL